MFEKHRLVRIFGKKCEKIQTLVFAKFNEDNEIFREFSIYFHFLYDGKMAITGDFGNWVLERCFYPVMKERLSEGYFLEKVCNKERFVFNSEKLNDSVKEELDKYMIEYDEYDLPCFKNKDDAIDFLEENIEDGFHFDLIDSEDINPSLRCIIDAYHYIFDNKIEVASL